MLCQLIGGLWSSYWLWLVSNVLPVQVCMYACFQAGNEWCREGLTNPVGAETFSPLLFVHTNWSGCRLCQTLCNHFYPVLGYKILPGTNLLHQLPLVILWRNERNGKRSSLPNERHLHRRAVISEWLTAWAWTLNILPVELVSSVSPVSKCHSESGKKPPISKKTALCLFAEGVHIVCLSPRGTDCDFLSALWEGRW